MEWTSGPTIDFGYFDYKGERKPDSVHGHRRLDLSRRQVSTAIRAYRPKLVCFKAMLEARIKEEDKKEKGSDGSAEENGVRQLLEVCEARLKYLDNLLKRINEGNWRELLPQVGESVVEP